MRTTVTAGASAGESMMTMQFPSIERARHARLAINTEVGLTESEIAIFNHAEPAIAPPADHAAQPTAEVSPAWLLAGVILGLLSATALIHWGPGVANSQPWLTYLAMIAPGLAFGFLLSSVVSATQSRSTGEDPPKTAAGSLIFKSASRPVLQQVSRIAQREGATLIQIS